MGQKNKNKSKVKAAIKILFGKILEAKNCSNVFSFSEERMAN